MNENKVYNGSWYVVVGFCLLAFVVACSRQEKAKEPDKKTQSFTVAPTPAVESVGQGSNNVPVHVVRMASSGKVSSVVSRPKASSEEDRKALRQRQQASRLKRQSEFSGKWQAEMDDISGKMAHVEAEAQNGNSALKTVWGELQVKKTEYDQVRYALPDMARLKSERDAAKTRLAELKARKEAGGAAVGLDQEIAAAKDDVASLGNRMFKIESVARTNSPALMKAVADLGSSESRYESILLAIPEYKALDEKRQEISKNLGLFTESQADLAPQEK